MKFKLNSIQKLSIEIFLLKTLLYIIYAAIIGLFLYVVLTALEELC